MAVEGHPETRFPSRAGADSESEVRSVTTNDEWIGIADVFAVSDGLVLICEVRGNRYGIPRDYIAKDSEVRRPGERGTLRVLRRCAEEMGLVQTSR